MMKILLPVALIVLGLGLGGCAQQETKEAAAPAAGGSASVAYEQAMAAATAAKKRAAAVGGEWRDTGTMMKKAEKAAAAGDYAQAKSLADKAAFQYNAGYEQAVSQQNVGNPAYLY